MERMSDFESGKRAVSMICNAGNGGRHSEIIEGMIDALRCEHRTLQADFWRIIQGTAVKYSEFNHDLRNQSAVELCREIKKIDKGIPRI